MKRIFFLFFLAHLIVISVFAQEAKTTISIKGQLLDEIGRYPVSGAKISIEGEKVHAISNEQGYFFMISRKEGKEKMLAVEWMGELRSIVFIPVEDSVLNLKQVLIDAPFSQALFVKPKPSIDSKE